TGDVWELLAEHFAHHDYVMFGLSNEPEYNYDGALNNDVWQAMNSTVAKIRAVEERLGVPNHIVAVQGTGGWSRFLAYYVTNPITAGGGENIAYEVHVYDPASDFDSMFIQPSKTLPVIIGEFGPAQGYMTMTDVSTLMEQAEDT